MGIECEAKKQTRQSVVRKRQISCAQVTLFVYVYTPTSPVSRNHVTCWYQDCLRVATFLLHILSYNLFLFLFIFHLPSSFLLLVVTRIVQSPRFITPNHLQPSLYLCYHPCSRDSAGVETASRTGIPRPPPPPHSTPPTSSVPRILIHPPFHPFLSNIQSYLHHVPRLPSRSLLCQLLPPSCRPHP